MTGVEMDAAMEQAKLLTNYMDKSERWRGLEVLKYIDRLIRHCAILEEELRMARTFNK